MYNSDLPRRADLPTSNQLFRSTAIAVIMAAGLLVTVVLPSEYGIDPTGAGRMLGLAQMGDIKTQLTAEAAADAAAATRRAEQADIAAKAARLSNMERQLEETEARLAAQQAKAAAALVTLIERQDPAPAPAPAATATPAEPAWRDEITIVLQPGQGVEFKLTMKQGARAQFEWTANGDVLNYDTHGDGNGQAVSYDKGRGVAEQTGEIEAAFDGIHGWFWRNRTDGDVTLTLRAKGAYSEFKRAV